MTSSVTSVITGSSIPYNLSFMFIRKNSVFKDVCSNVFYLDLYEELTDNFIDSTLIMFHSTVTRLIHTALIRIRAILRNWGFSFPIWDSGVWQDWENYKSHSEYLEAHPALAYSLTCEATLRAAGLCIQNRANTVETAWGELVVVLLVPWCCSCKHDEVAIFTTRST